MTLHPDDIEAARRIEALAMHKMLPPTIEELAEIIANVTGALRKKNNELQDKYDQLRAAYDAIGPCARMQDKDGFGGHI